MYIVTIKKLFEYFNKALQVSMLPVLPRWAVRWYRDICGSC